MPMSAQLETALMPDTPEIPAIAVPALYEGEQAYLALLNYVLHHGVIKRQPVTGCGALDRIGHPRQLRPSTAL